MKLLNKHKIEYHRKYTLSVACLIFFLIGAPLGAIIRRGGFGLPVVVSVLFFVIYHVISVIGEKFARESVFPVSAGMWLSTIITLPLGIWLAYKATTDSPILDAELWTRFFRKIYLVKKEKPEIK
jgi:lipopolysaccharide export system permease protein